MFTINVKDGKMDKKVGKIYDDESASKDRPDRAVALKRWLYGAIGLILMPIIAVWMHFYKPTDILQRVIKEDNYLISLIYTISPIAIIVIILLAI